MNVEERINKKMEELLASDYIEKQVEESFKKAVDKTLENLTGWYSPVQKLIEKSLKEAMVPIIESYDYSKYVTKLDKTLDIILKEQLMENNTILKNFKKSLEEVPKKVSIKDMLKEYAKYLDSEIDRDDMNYDEEGNYYSIDCDVSVEKVGYFKDKTQLVFTNEVDSDLNYTVNLTTYRLNGHTEVDMGGSLDLKRLRFLSEFAVYLINLERCGTEITWDSEYEAMEADISGNHYEE